MTIIDYLRYMVFRKTCHCPGCRNSTDPHRAPSFGFTIRTDKS